jgi:preprotein translocase subunit SecG
MFIVLMIVHIIACLVLISVILLQAGRGGGLAESMGGAETQSVLGTQAPVLLKKATSVSAIVFLVTSLVLGMITARRGRSIFTNMNLPAGTQVPTQSAPKDVPEVPVAEDAS